MVRPRIFAIQPRNKRVLHNLFHQPLTPEHIIDTMWRRHISTVLWSRLAPRSSSHRFSHSGGLRNPETALQSEALLHLQFPLARGFSSPRSTDASSASVGQSETKSKSTGGSTGRGRLADLSGIGPKRFYDHVDVRQESPESHAVTVDGKVVRTPRRHLLATPSLPLSLAIAAEWDAQETRLRPSSMPLTALAFAALDIAPQFREKITSAVMRFVHTDSATVRADTPKELVVHQDKAYADVLAHATSQGAHVRVARGVLDARQDASVERWMRDVLTGLDDWSLVAVDSAAATAKSALVAAALLHGAITAEQAVHAARSEERWQAKVWGTVEGGHDLDDADTTVRLAAADTIFRFVQMYPRAFIPPPQQQ